MATYKYASTRLDNELASKLEQIAQAKGCTLSKLIHELCVTAANPFNASSDFDLTEEVLDSKCRFVDGKSNTVLMRVKLKGTGSTYKTKDKDWAQYIYILSNDRKQKLQKIADNKGLALATMIRGMCLAWLESKRNNEADGLGAMVVNEQPKDGTKTEKIGLRFNKEDKEAILIYLKEQGNTFAGLITSLTDACIEE